MVATGIWLLSVNDETVTLDLDRLEVDAIAFRRRFGATPSGKRS
jgi:hypothetical protein